MPRRLLAAAALLPACPALAQDFLMVVDSGTDTVLMFSPADGTPMGTFCTMPVTGSGATPKEALQVGPEVWVSDQLQDNILAFDASGTLIGPVLGPAQGLDNVRGFEVAAGKIWVGCGSGTYAGQVAVFDQATRAFLFAVPVGGSPFDCYDHHGEILVTNSSSHDVDRVGYDGTILGKFVDSSGPDAPLDFPQQSVRNLSGSEVLIAEFSSTEELFRFDASTGALLQEIDTAPQGGARGVFELADGRYLFTNGNGVHTWSPAGVVSLYSGSGCQYVSLYHPVPSCPADFNSDGFLDFLDYDDYVSCFETGVCPAGRTADFNGDGFADFFDYDDFVAAFERGC